MKGIISPFCLVDYLKNYEPRKEGSVFNNHLVFKEDEGATGGQVELREPVEPMTVARGIKVRTVQDELREVLMQVKNGEMNTREAEIFFNTWIQQTYVQKDADKKKVSCLKTLHRKFSSLKLNYREFLCFSARQSS